jgi:hypothetical protein
MATNATAEHVAIVLVALAEEFLVDVPAVHTKDGVYYIEYNTLANALINGDKEWYAAIAQHINNAPIEA